jgi:hypothetical protein
VIVLVACEESGTVREAFRARGHDAWLCDLLPARDGSRYHFTDDIRAVLFYAGVKWNLMVAFPPCTDLAVSGARWFPEKRADGRQKAALDFVRFLMGVPIPRIAIENPVGVISTAIRKPDQTIQPWQFWDGPAGCGEVKRTCLWLKGLPKLVPTTPNESGRHPGCWLMAPGPNRARDRSVTYQGIAEAMASQWGVLEPKP